MLILHHMSPRRKGRVSKNLKGQQSWDMALGLERWGGFGHMELGRKGRLGGNQDSGAFLPLLHHFPLPFPFALCLRCTLTSQAVLAIAPLVSPIV